MWFRWLGCEGAANLPQAVVITLLAIFVVWKHRANIARLLAGNENKIYLFRKGEKK